MNIPAIIPARGGSKSIPHKNVIEIAGKPLVAWSILQALQSDLVTEVIVSTDNDVIASVSASYGAKVFWRSHATATDLASSESALIEVLEGGSYDTADAIVFLQATSPIRQQGEIDTAIRMVLDGEADAVLSARKVEGYPWRWLGNVTSPLYSHRVPRQQQSVWTLEENGSIYAFRPSILLQGGSRIGGTIRQLIMHPLDSFQIDEPEDVAMVEQFMTQRLSHGGHRTASHR